MSDTPTEPTDILGKIPDSYFTKALEEFEAFLAGESASTFPPHVAAVTRAGLQAAIDAEVRGDNPLVAYDEAARDASVAEFRRLYDATSAEALTEIAGDLADDAWGRADKVYQQPGSKHDDQCEGPDRCECRRRRVLAALTREHNGRPTFVALLEGENAGGSELLFDGDVGDMAFASMLVDMVRIAYDAGRKREQNDILMASRNLYSGVLATAGITAQANLEQIMETSDVTAGIAPGPEQIDLAFASWLSTAGVSVSHRNAYEAGIELERFRLTERLAYVDSVTGAIPPTDGFSQRVARAVLGAKGHEVYSAYAEPHSFARMVVDMVTKCDVFNRRLFRRSFPDWVDAVDLYEEDVEKLLAIATTPGGSRG